MDYRPATLADVAAWAAMNALPSRIRLQTAMSGQYRPQSADGYWRGITRRRSFLRRSRFLQPLHERGMIVTRDALLYDGSKSG